MPETAPSASTASTLRPLIDILAELVGAAHVLTHDDPATDLSAWENDWRKRQQGRALAVVRPGCTEEVAAGVRARAAAGGSIVPQGGHTGLLPAGDFSAELQAARGEVLRAVVALPGACGVFGPARAHTA